MQEVDVQSIIDSSLAFYRGCDRSIFGRFVTASTEELALYDMRQCVAHGGMTPRTKEESNRDLERVRIWGKENVTSHLSETHLLAAERFVWRKITDDFLLEIPSVNESYWLLVKLKMYPQHMDFFSAGIFDLKEIERFKDNGIDANLAAMAVA